MTQVSVVFDLPVDRPFSYLTPPDIASQAVPGKRVLAPFGRSSRIGYIVGQGDFSSKGHKLKEIVDILDYKPLLDPPMLELTGWMAQYYLCSWGEAIKAVLPQGINLKTRRKLRLISLPDNLSDLSKRAPLQAKILAVLKTEKEIFLDEMSKKVGRKTFYLSLNSLEDKGYLQIEDELPPPRVKPKEIRVVDLARPVEEIKAEDLPLKQDKIIKTLVESQTPLTSTELAARTGTSLSPIQTLVKRGVLRIERKEIPRLPYPTTASHLELTKDTSHRNLKLTEEQEKALGVLIHHINERRFSVTLLHGVTGSGKTEVYLRAIAQVIQRGEGAICLVPEISLTPQTVTRFAARFPGQVAVLHSQLSPGERYDEWRRIKSGQTPVVVGARSAVFAPLPKLGLIIVDEEHEPSYKQEEKKPRYHARDVAIMRAKLSGAVVLLGSATPSLRSYYNTRTGKFYYLEMKSRVDEAQLPEVKLVDMRAELSGNKKQHIFSLALVEAMTERLDRGEQTILFLNRRGFANFVQCRKCGFVFGCPACSVSLTYHAAGLKLRCHYCDYRRPLPHICPECQGDKIRHWGLGTQRVEEELTRLFPQARIGRLDRDTTTRRKSLEDMLSSFQHGGIDILVGTQMIAKGLDFPQVTLVGVISADTALNLPDFQAAERTFSLLTQVAGRAGRGKRPGLVIIQTYTPQHYSLQATVTHDYHSFYRQEIAIREALAYPPFAHLTKITIKGPEESQVARAAIDLGQRLRDRKAKQKPVNILGPAPCPISKIKGEFRYQILLKGKTQPAIRELIVSALEEFSPSGKVEIALDVDPIGML
ncbi:MAG: primosomal protein N' [bacterium]